MKIVGVDPGETTGLAAFTLTNGAVLSCTGATEATDVEGVCAFLDEHRPDFVVVEAFTLYPWAARSMSWNKMPASQVIGAVKAWRAKCRKRPRLVEQPASVRGHVQTTVFKVMGCADMFVNKPHARDAAKHALWFCWRRWPECYIRYLKQIRKEGEASRGRKSGKETGGTAKQGAVSPLRRV